MFVPPTARSRLPLFHTAVVCPPHPVCFPTTCLFAQTKVRRIFACPPPLPSSSSSSFTPSDTTTTTSSFTPSDTTTATTTVPPLWLLSSPPLLVLPVEGRGPTSAMHVPPPGLLATPEMPSTFFPFLWNCQIFPAIETLHRRTATEETPLRGREVLQAFAHPRNKKAEIARKKRRKRMGERVSLRFR
eukprot:GHVS01005719.1.p1 GENE.GHVS01005719.1~~GHVS01005719.1.p1  ORF type:complete len:187 (+),score=53.18 GHVS01005719.1:50-610(+)